MSVYASAFMGVADMLTGASEDAAYEAAYGQYYRAYAGMHNAANRKVAAEANIAAITQDKINTDKVIAMKQDEAEAQAKVMAAVTGTEGQSVNDTIAQSRMNSSIAKQNNARHAEQQIEQQLSQIYSAQTSIQAAASSPQIADVNPWSGAINTVAALIGNESERGELMEGVSNMMQQAGDIFLPQ